jgi:ribonuclease P protein component
VDRNWQSTITIYGETLNRFSLPKSKRLVSNGHFKAVLARNPRVSNGLLMLYMAKNNCGYPRLGISVGKACGNAVVRNQLKRLLREAFRQSQDQIPPDFDYLLMISPKWSKKFDKSAYKKGQPTCEQVKTSFLALITAMVKRNSQTQ